MEGGHTHADGGLSLAANILTELFLTATSGSRISRSPAACRKKLLEAFSFFDGKEESEKLIFKESELHGAAR